MAVKTIALVVPSLRIGGMERVAIILAKEFAALDEFDVHLITFSSHERSYKVPEGIQCHVPAFNTSDLSFFQAFIRSLWFVRKVIRSTEADCLISFGDRYNAFVILASLGINVRVFVSNRQNPNLSNGVAIDLLNKIFYPFASGLIAQTSRARQIFSGRYLQKNIVVIPNPFHVGQNLIDRRRDVILNVGRFSSDKNQQLLLQYYKDLCKWDWELILVGDGPLRKEVEREIVNSDLDDFVHVSGFVDNVYDYYDQAAIFAFTSYSEGFPNALGEAMASGCACIAFDCETGPSDLIDNGVDGFLIPVGDHAQYKQKLFHLMIDRDLRTRMGANARQKMEIFTPEIIARKYLDFIANLF